MSKDTSTGQAPRGGILRPWIVAVLLCVGYLGFVFLNYYGLHFDTQSPRVAGIPLNLGLLPMRYSGQALEFIWPTSAGAAGYDGQFTYDIAANPLHAAPKLDVPAYRYQRILH